MNNFKNSDKEDRGIQIECANPQNIDFSYQALNNIALLQVAKNELPLFGTLQYDEFSPYCYLKVDDQFISKLFPLLQENNIILPDYFPPKSNCGAHISIIYPLEKNASHIIATIKEKIIDQAFFFELYHLFVLNVFKKRFFALQVVSLELEKLRTQNNLSSRPNYRGLLVPFHITIAMGAT